MGCLALWQVMIHVRTGFWSICKMNQLANSSLAICMYFIRLVAVAEVSVHLVAVTVTVDHMTYLRLRVFHLVLRKHQPACRRILLTQTAFHSMLR
mmetsp:Transcript_161081/g.294246  ORF Transcript_161081/g.294246 Transcript_161081/m.294246 type:complete len:95 (+) Transcript_161081:502-786(+)